MNSVKVGQEVTNGYVVYEVTSIDRISVKVVRADHGEPIQQLSVGKLFSNYDANIFKPVEKTCVVLRDSKGRFAAKPKFKIGDRVRTRKDKGYCGNLIRVVLEVLDQRENSSTGKREWGYKVACPVGSFSGFQDSDLELA